uniref:Bet v I/Major latex protein domain-containing protein n=1 Tax=Ananas comosus var. bracteatus TaxID=296719 RepID=A0A6V7QPA3_ANACO|nr:unnamed protein product [Ananas comosus var. bracteatus]
MKKPRRSDEGKPLHELEVGLPAGEIWEVYGTLRLARLAVELLPNILQKADIVHGDGGVGTVLHLTFPPGNPGPQYYKEKFTKVDNDNYVKEAVVIEGGYLQLGFTSYLVRFEILWAVYGTLRLVQLAAELLPNIVQKVSTVHGDGEVGTVIQVNFVPGIPCPPYQKEEFVKVDNKNRVKEAKVIEAGFLLFGFQSYLMRFEIVKKDNDSSVIRSTVEYEIDDEHASNASLVTTDLVATIAQVIAKYLKDQKSSPPSS